ncbi:hypothetical protein I5G59_gp88 [Mycobacterium phage LilMcDreamy]|uniref:Uncharacterized protein n=1 Tax=Mycobacterium phage LilMcDreamy TaxID=2652422 RepID=A0A5P8D6U1_9CAUD|nr:hypothetical protein I5G59_gp88 [Mycobacterium phage LilMcDreamy]QFP94708.1 hypothetical protein SEA_LILMCDREAMY_88 [Mycobacterium phage LilMcDreamy]
MSNENEASTVAADRAPVSAAQLRAEADRARRVADELTRQAAEQAVAEEEARKPKMPAVEEGESVYVAFDRYQSGRNYAYAAVGFRTGRSVRWAVTGEETRRFNWPGLLAFVGEANWVTLRRLSGDGESLLPEGYEPAVAEEMGRFGRVVGTSDPSEGQSVVAALVGFRPGGVYPAPGGGGRGGRSPFAGPGLYRDGDDPYMPGSQR